MKTLLENLGPVGRKLARFVATKKPSKPVVLRPQGRERGCVVISYITWPFREGWDSPKARGHTNAFEVVAMAETWGDQGFRVEICDYDNTEYNPPSDCRVAIDLHSNLDRWATQLPADCIKILHATGCHWRFQNEAERGRLSQIHRRRGQTLQPRRQVAASAAAEAADLIATTGNHFTMGTFSFAGKPMTRIPISSAYEFVWPEHRDLEQAKRRFLWLASYGMTHKGLDLLLEAFAEMPELRLTVCGRPEKEDDFFALYEHELKDTPNIDFRGWLDLASPECSEIAASHATVIYPSCSEGGGGSVIHCMHAGMLPACTTEASVDLGDFGVHIKDGTVDAVRAAARRIASMSTSEVAERARKSWEHVRDRHTRDQFRKNYANFAARVVEELPA